MKPHSSLLQSDTNTQLKAKLAAATSSQATKKKRAHEEKSQEKVHDVVNSDESDYADSVDIEKLELIVEQKPPQTACTLATALSNHRCLKCRNCKAFKDAEDSPTSSTCYKIKKMPLAWLTERRIDKIERQTKKNLIKLQRKLKLNDLPALPFTPESQADERTIEAAYLKKLDSLISPNANDDQFVSV